jgi:hypothetical protein
LVETKKLLPNQIRAAFFSSIVKMKHCVIRADEEVERDPHSYGSNNAQFCPFDKSRFDHQNRKRDEVNNESE